jgi:peptidoglycan/xylan/chitin deacetylase (PgdA/CDA1 family)
MLNLNMSLTRGEFIKTVGRSALGFTLLSPVCRLLAQTESTNYLEEAKSPIPKELSAMYVNHGPGFGRRIAITFDDGPTPGVTEVVLEALHKRSLKATFFMIGHRVKESPELAKKVFEAGHEIGNHSFTHPKLSSLSDERVAQEIGGCQEIIHQTLNIKPVWFRPPYGAFRKSQGSFAVAESVGVAYWSVDPRDWSQPGSSAITARVLNETKPGSIILMHDLHKQTAEAVANTLDGLLEREFEFTTLSGFLGKPYS